MASYLNGLYLVDIIDLFREAPAGYYCVNLNVINPHVSVKDLPIMKIYMISFYEFQEKVCPILCI